MPNLAADVVRESGRFTAFSVDVARAAFRRPFQVRELVQQSWFVASVSILPTTLVAIPFGAIMRYGITMTMARVGERWRAERVVFAGSSGGVLP